MPDVFTCITCQVLFKSAELQREHYKLDWHRYNLKRKVADIPPVTLEEFEQRAEEHRELAENTNLDVSSYCKCCSKLFNSKNSYASHLNSKKHKQAEENYAHVNKEDQTTHSDSDSFVKVEPQAEILVKQSEPDKFVVLNADASDDHDIETDSEIEEIESDEWDDDQESERYSLIPLNDCLFCSHHNKSMIKSLKHMSEKHSFFIPDVEYCVDIRGLLDYLGEKISREYMCIWCNESGRSFQSMDAVRRHMIDKGHCKMFHEAVALYEYTDFYDYSASYPDDTKGDDKDMDVDEEAEPETEEPTVLDGDNYQLVLPSGAVIGHRSLMRYYKQNVKQTSGALVKKSDRKLNQLLGVYKSLGWTQKEQKMAAKKARDIHFMKRVESKWQMKLALKANKFQKYYREQVNF